MSVNNNARARFIHYVRDGALYCYKNFIKRLIKRKKVNEIEIQYANQNHLRQTLRWYELTAIGLGAIIGAGIIVLSGQAAAKYSGPSVIISFLITGFVALLSSLSFSELAAMMSVSGAAYTYTYAALGEYVAWFIGWNYALLYQLAASTVVVNWSNQLVNFIELVSDYNVTKMVVEAPVAWNATALSFVRTGQAIDLPAIAITIILTIVLISGIRPTAIFNLVLVVIKIIILLIFIFACCIYVDRTNYEPFFPPNQGSFSKYGVTGMLYACTSVFFAYMGFESVATVAQEARQPLVRSVSFAIIASVIISLLISIGICTVMVGLVPYNLLDSDSPLSVAVKHTPYGLWLSIIMNLGALAGLTTVALTMLLSQTRIFYAMALDGILPKFFAVTAHRTNIPWISTIISGIVCAVLSALFPVDITEKTATISGLMIFIFVHIDVIVMRRTHPDIPRRFRVPCGSWLLPTLGLLLCILLLIKTSKEAGYGFLVWTALGQIVYFSYGFWHSKKRRPAPEGSTRSSIELVSTVGSVINGHMHNECAPDLTNEANKGEVEEDLVQYF